jgi:hypothetical protein
LWLRTVPAVAITSVWHAVLRVVLLLVVLASVGPLPAAVAWPLLLVALIASSLALDLARVGVVLHDAPGFHIRTAAYAYVQAFKRWRLLVGVAAPWLLQVAASLASGWIALHSLGAGGQLWVARALTLVAVAAGLWRLAMVVDAGRVPLQPETDG